MGFVAACEDADLADAAGGADPLGEREGFAGGGGAVVDLGLTQQSFGLASPLIPGEERPFLRSHRPSPDGYAAPVAAGAHHQTHLWDQPVYVAPYARAAAGSNAPTSPLPPPAPCTSKPPASRSAWEG